LAEALVPADLFLEVCLGLSTGQIELAKKMRSEGISEEQKDLMKTVQDIAGPTLPAGGFGGPAPAIKKPVTRTRGR
jgi:hypothetical protein